MFSPWHLIILLVIVVLLFGTSKLTKIGPDLGNALRGFKKALQGDDEADKHTQAGGEKLQADPPTAADATHQEHSDSSEPK